MKPGMDPQDYAPNFDSIDRWMVEGFDALGSILSMLDDALPDAGSQAAVDDLRQRLGDLAERYRTTIGRFSEQY
jgi:hypothetical protein